ncbi:hypothetical protein [Microbacterium sp. MMO-10]|uniref:hypothetical protein n=1 Tax=Microbacterium sp. MMO-10 TaxID=3081272 RepID=UPI003017254E
MTIRLRPSPSTPRRGVRRRVAAVLVAALVAGSAAIAVVLPAAAAEESAEVAHPADPGVASVDFAPNGGLPYLDKWIVVAPEGTQLDPATGHSTAWVDGINDRGEMYGQSGRDENRTPMRATRWNADGTIAEVWGIGSTAKDLNEAGTMVGTVADGDAPAHAAVWRDGVQILLPDDGAEESAADDINDNS